MDRKLLAWGRAVKARRPRHLPPLWLFTDPARAPQLERDVAALPRGLCGVVFRHDGAPGRALLLARLHRLCRYRRLALVAAGDGPLPAGVGRHWRGGVGTRRGARLITCSAHGRGDLVRAVRRNVGLVFFSPAFPTDSHPRALALGPVRWAAQTRGLRVPVLALGGVTGRNVRRLPRKLAGVGAIGALLA